MDRCGTCQETIREVSFFTGRGAPKIGGSGTFSYIKRGSEDFFKLKRGNHLYFLKEIKYFVKHSWNSC